MTRDRVAAKLVGGNEGPGAVQGPRVTSALDHPSRMQSVPIAVACITATVMVAKKGIDRYEGSVVEAQGCPADVASADIPADPCGRVARTRKPEPPIGSTVVPAPIVRCHPAPRMVWHPGPPAVGVGPPSVTIGAPVQTDRRPPSPGIEVVAIGPVPIGFKLCDLMDHRAGYILTPTDIALAAAVLLQSRHLPVGKIIHLGGIECSRRGRCGSGLRVAPLTATHRLSKSTGYQLGDALENRQPDPLFSIDIEPVTTSCRKQGATVRGIDAQRRRYRSRGTPMQDQATSPHPQDRPLAAAVSQRHDIEGGTAVDPDERAAGKQ